MKSQRVTAYFRFWVRKYAMAEWREPRLPLSMIAATDERKQRLAERDSSIPFGSCRCQARRRQHRAWLQLTGKNCGTQASSSLLWYFFAPSFSVRVKKEEKKKHKCRGITKNVKAIGTERKGATTRPKKGGEGRS